LKNKKKLNLVTLKNNQTSPSVPPRKKTAWDSSHPQNKITSPSPTQKNSFESGWNYSILPSSPKKSPFEFYFFNPSSSFLKAPFTTYNSFSLLELSTPYTHLNPKIIIKNKPMRRKFFIKMLTLLLVLNFHL
jgi:hypothetical protein